MSDVTTELSHEAAGSLPLRDDSPRQHRDLRRRLLRQYLPIALASSLALVVFMNISFFNANRYPPPMEIMVEGFSGAFGEATPMGPGMHDAGQAEAPEPGGGQSGMPGMDHGAGQSGAPATEPAGGQPGAPPTGAAEDIDMPDLGTPGDTEKLMRKYATATGYIALVLLGLTLLIGPANLMRGRRAPLSTYLCRDVGIAAATLSIAHVIFGFLAQHSEGILSYFFQQDDRSRILTTSFGLANWTGLAAVIIVAALAAISSDWALRKLRAKRWKRIQRLNYILFPLVVGHAILYGALLRLTSPYTALLGVIVVAVVVGQAVGIRLWRQRNARRTATAAA